MAPTFFFAIAEQLLGKLSSPFLKEISLAWGVRDEICRLENTVSCVGSVLLDAQERQETNHQLKNWLYKLEVALYHAQDVIEEFEIDVLRYKVRDQTILGKVRREFSLSNRTVFRFKLANKMKKIMKEFDEIYANMSKFNLNKRRDERVVVHREITHSFLRDEDIVGRDEEREIVTKILMAKTNDETVSVLSIIGVYGIGKTTLARLVYNDERVVTHFDSRIWVPIPEEFELERVIRNILKSAGIIGYYNLSPQQLRKDLREMLKNRNYLIILDDVRNENHAQWKALRDLLVGCPGASKIIIITRDISMAYNMSKSNLKIEIKGQSHEDSRCLFLKCAFRSSQDATTHQNLIEIGGSIAKKCKGVPFAVKILGSALYANTDKREWIKVRDSEIWKIEQEEDDIMPALLLSYYQLPTNLQQCFAFCSIFPENYEFNSQSLSMFWQANGLLQHIGDNHEMEDVGLMYIKQLQSRGFFQDFDNYGAIVSFKMHHFVHCLALLVAARDCINLNSVGNVSSSRTVRHVSFPTNSFSSKEIPRSLLDCKDNLHTLYFPNGVGASRTSFIETCISKFKSLRLLDIHYASFEAFPSSIGSMKHLKHLDLSDNCKLKALPSSICDLVGLEFLRFNGCLNIEKLPRGLDKLVRLRTLGITTQDLYLPYDEIRCLTTLQHLTVSCSPNLKLFMSDDALESLSALRTLGISRCESLESLPVNGLRHLTRLETLAISDCAHLIFITDTNYVNGEKGSERRGKGLSSLLTLSIRGFHNLESLPMGLLHGAYNLKFIFIDECDNLIKLMPEQFPESLESLQGLYVTDCPKLKSQEMRFFTALDELSICNCRELIKRCQRDTGEEWHNISHVPNIYLN